VKLKSLRFPGMSLAQASTHITQKGWAGYVLQMVLNDPNNIGAIMRVPENFSEDDPASALPAPDRLVQFYTLRDRYLYAVSLQQTLAREGAGAMNDAIAELYRQVQRLAVDPKQQI
jgi:hypothetical protein